MTNSDDAVPHPRTSDTPEPVPDTSTPDAVKTAAPTVLEQLGGVSGLVYSTLPVVVFVPFNSYFGLSVALWAALGVAAAVLVWRLVRRSPIQPAISGFFGVGICAFIAYRTGDAKGYFLFGIYTSLVYGGAFVLSVLARWPLVGVIWASTAFIQVPMHNVLGRGFDADAHAHLVSTNWIRTIAWSARAALLAWCIWNILCGTTASATNGASA